MSQKDISLSQSSQKRFSRTKPQKSQRVVIQKQIILNTSGKKIKTQSSSQSQIIQSNKTQEDKTNYKNKPLYTSREVAVSQSNSASKIPNQSRLLSKIKKQQQVLSQNKEESLDPMALSQQIKQALKKVQRFDRYIYPKLSQKELGQTLKNQVTRLEKIKNSRRQMRSKYYDTQLLATALYNHVKLVNQLSKQNDQLLIWKKQRQKQMQSIKKSTNNLKQRLQQQKSKQEQIIEKQLNDKDYTNAKNSLSTFLRKFEKETTIQISTIQITLMNHMKILIEEKEKNSKTNFSPFQQKTETSKQTAKKNLTPNKVKLQNQQLKELQGIDAQLSAKNYPTAKNLIKNYIKKFEQQEQLSTTNEIAVFQYITIIIDQFQALKNATKLQINNNTNLQKQRSKSNQQKFLNKSVDLDKSRLQSENQRLKSNLQNQKTKYLELLKKNQQNEKSIRQLKSNTTQRQLSKLKSQKEKLIETLEKQKNKVSQFQRKIQGQRTKFIQIQTKNMQSSDSRSKTGTPLKGYTLTPERTKTQFPQSTEKNDSKQKIKELTKQIEQWKKEDTKNKTQIKKLEKLIVKLQSQLGVQQSNIQASRGDINKSEQKNQKNKSLQKPTKALTKHELMNRQRQIERQKSLIQGHLRDKHYYYAKPMLISFLRNFEQLQEYQQLTKYFSYFLGIIQDLDLAKKQVSDAKLGISVTPQKTPKKQQKNQEVIAIQKQIKEMKAVLIQKQQIITETNITITKLIQIIEEGGQWWKKLPRRNFKASQLVVSLYRIIDKFVQAENQKNQYIIELQRKIQTLNENSEQINNVLTILKTVQSVIKKKQYAGNQKDPWVQIFKGANTRKQIFSILNRVLNSLVNENKNKLITQRKNYQNSIKGYQKEIASLTMKVQQVQSKLKTVQQQTNLKTSGVKSFKSKNLKDQQKQKNDQNFKLLQQYIQEQKKMLKQLQKIENQKQSLNQRFILIDNKFKESQRDLLKSNKRIKQLEQVNVKLTNENNSIKQQILRIENQKASLKVVIEKQLKGNESRQIQNLERQWNAERTNLQRQITAKQNLLILKQNQLRQQFDREKTILISRLEKEFFVKETQNRQTIVQQFRVKEQTLIRQFAQRQKTIISQTNDLQVRQLNVKLLKLESQLNKYIAITESKQTQINGLRLEMDKIIQQQVQNALRAQQADFNQFLQKNDKERQQYYENVIIPQRKQQWKIQFSTFRPIQKTTININQQRIKIQNQWREKMLTKQRQFEARLAQIISNTDKKWTSQIQRILKQKEVEWNNKFVTQLKQERQKMFIQKNTNSTTQINNLIVQKQNQWNRQLLKRLQQQRLRIMRQKDDQYLKIIREKQTNWNKIFLTKEKQWQNTLIQRQKQIRTHIQTTVIKQPENQEIKLLRQIISNQKIQLSQMKILLEKVQFNQTNNATSQKQSLLRYKQIQLQQTKALYEVKSQYEMRINSLEKDITILQDKLGQAQMTINNYKSASPAHRQSKNALMELQKQVIILGNNNQSKENEIGYLKKNIDNLQTQIREQRNIINQLRLKLASNGTQNTNNQNKYFELQYETRMLKDRQQSLLRQIQSNELVSTQLRRNYENKINELSQQNNQQQRQLLKISKMNQLLKQDAFHLQSQLRKNNNGEKSNFQYIKLKQILRSIQVQKEKKVYVLGKSDQTYMQILRKISLQISQLVQSNRHLQTKIILMQKQAELNAYSPDAINFFLMMQHRLDILINFLLQNEYITNNQAYSQFLHQSRGYLKQIRIQQYFNQFTKLMKQLFHQVYQLNSQQIELKANQLSQLKVQMQQILNKQIQISDQNQYYNYNSHINNSHYHDINNDSSTNKAIHDVKYLMKQYLRRRDEECLGAVCRTLGLQF